MSTPDGSGTLAQVLAEYAETEAALADPAVHADQNAARRLGRRFAQLSPIVSTSRELDSVRADEQAARELAKAPTTAVLAYNDQVAMGVMRGLAQLGASVPGDVSVVGFDNILPAELVTPTLTTVGAPLRSMGGTAVTNLLAYIGGATRGSGQPVVLPTRLVVRESTAQRSRKRTSPAWGTTKVSGSASNSATSTSRGSR